MVSDELNHVLNLYLRETVRLALKNNDPLTKITPKTMEGHREKGKRLTEKYGKEAKENLMKQGIVFTKEFNDFFSQ